MNALETSNMIKYCKSYFEIQGKNNFSQKILSITKTQLILSFSLGNIK